MPTRIAAEFLLTGIGFDPHDITTMLGVEPTMTRRVGDQVQNTLLRSKVDLWEISTGYHEWDAEHGIDVPRLIRSVFDRLRSRTLELTQVREAHRLDATLGCVLYVEGDDRPWIHVDSDIVQWAAQVGAAMNVDYYCLS